jgi:hypothetical protein
MDRSFSTSMFAAVVAALVGAAASTAGAAPTSFVAQGTGATGYLSVSNINNETVQPNTALAGSKPFQYPVYFDAAQNLWVTVVAEKLSASSVYAEESAYTVVNKGVTDPDFADFRFGSFGWDSSQLTGSGVEVLGIGAFSLTLDALDYSPKPKSRNAAPTFNEFNWTYGITASNLVGDGLTFVDGVLVRADFTADVQVDVFFNGNTTNAFFRFNPGFSEAGGLTVSGNTFAFDLDAAVPQASPLGALAGARMVFNRSGTIDGISGVIPEPSTWAALGIGLALMSGVAARRRSPRRQGSPAESLAAAASMAR